MGDLRSVFSERLHAFPSRLSRPRQVLRCRLRVSLERLIQEVRLAPRSPLHVYAIPEPPPVGRNTDEVEGCLLVRSQRLDSARGGCRACKRLVRISQSLLRSRLLHEQRGSLRIKPHARISERLLGILQGLAASSLSMQGLPGGLLLRFLLVQGICCVDVLPEGSVLCRTLGDFRLQRAQILCLLLQIDHLLARHERWDGLSLALHCGGDRIYPCGDFFEGLLLKRLEGFARVFVLLLRCGYGFV